MRDIVPLSAALHWPQLHGGDLPELHQPSEAELQAAQTAFAREAPWDFAVLREDGRD